MSHVHSPSTLFNTTSDNHSTSGINSGHEQPLFMGKGCRYEIENDFCWPHGEHGHNGCAKIRQD